MLRLDRTNPMNATIRIILVFELIIVWLAFPGMMQVEGADTILALMCCLATTIVLVAAAGTLKKPYGYPLGWLAQVVLLLLGFLTPWMIAMGIIFAIIWGTSFVLGKRIEAKRKGSQ